MCTNIACFQQSSGFNVPVRQVTVRQRAHKSITCANKRTIEVYASETSQLLSVHSEQNPDHFDVLLGDIDEEDLRTEIAEELGIDFLSNATSPPRLPVHGFLFGRHSRPMVSLSVERRTRAVNVFFLVDTGSPYTYLSPASLNELGFKDSLPNSFQPKVHGVKLTAYTSPQDKHFKDLNILGSDFLRLIRGHVSLNYEDLTFSIDGRV